MLDTAHPKLDTHRLFAFGATSPRYAQAIASATPPENAMGDFAVIVCDGEDAGQAIATAVQLKRSGLRVAIAPLVASEDVITARWSAAYMHTYVTDPDELRIAFEAIKLGTCTIDHPQLTGIIAEHRRRMAAMRTLLQIGDAVIIRSHAERERISRTLNLRPANVMFFAPAHSDIPDIRARPDARKIVVWAPHLMTVDIAHFRYAFRYVQDPPIFICRNADSGTRDEFRTLEESAGALAQAGVVIDADPYDPGAAIAFAKRGFGICAAATSGANEYLDGISTYVPDDFTTILGAASRARADRRTMRIASRNTHDDLMQLGIDRRTANSDYGALSVSVVTSAQVVSGDSGVPATKIFDAGAKTAAEALAATNTDSRGATFADARVETIADAGAAIIADAGEATFTNARAATITDSRAATFTDGRPATIADPQATILSAVRAARMAENDKSRVLVSIIVTRYTDAAELSAFATAVAKQSHRTFELIAASTGNAAADASLKNAYPFSHFANGSTKNAPSNIINLLAAARGTYIVIADGRIRLFPTAIERLIENAYSQEAVVIAQSIITGAVTNNAPAIMHNFGPPLENANVQEYVQANVHADVHEDARVVDDPFDDVHAPLCLLFHRAMLGQSGIIGDMRSAPTSADLRAAILRTGEMVMLEGGTAEIVASQRTPAMRSAGDGVRYATAGAPA